MDQKRSEIKTSLVHQVFFKFFEWRFAETYAIGESQSMNWGCRRTVLSLRIQPLRRSLPFFFSKLGYYVQVGVKMQAESLSVIAEVWTNKRGRRGGGITINGLLLVLHETYWQQCLEPNWTMDPDLTAPVQIICEAMLNSFKCTVHKVASGGSSHDCLQKVPHPTTGWRFVPFSEVECGSWDDLVS